MPRGVFLFKISGWVQNLRYKNEKAPPWCEWFNLAPGWGLVRS